MAAKDIGLGRGLAALFEDIQGDEGRTETSTIGTEEDQPQGRLLLPPLEQIFPNPDQPRRNFEEDALKDLAASIKAQGLLQPILVREREPGHYQIIAGERRWRAAKEAGLAQVPVIARMLDDGQSMAAALIENLQREDLNPLEEAQGLEALRIALALSQEDLAAKLGKSRPAIANSLRLLNLPDTAKEDLREGRLGAGHARTLLAVQDPIRQEELHQHLLEDQLTVREAEAAVHYLREQGHFPWNRQLPIVQQDAGGPAQATQHAPRSETAHGAGPQEQLSLIQSLVSEHFKCRAKISGNSSRGKISLSYKSAAQLAEILKRLGLDLPA